VRVMRGSAIVVIAACLGISHPAGAQQPYPSKPVRMVVPFAPGGASDFVGRMLQKRMSELLGQQVVIDNRPGAAGNIGVELAAKAPADGYTVLLGNIGTMAINPTLYPSFPVRPARDLIPVTQVVDVPGALVAHPSLPVKTIKDLVAYARANPGKLNFASPGAGSLARLDMELFMLDAGVKMINVPFKGGAGPATTSVVSNETQLMMVSLSSIVSLVQQGRLRLLGVVAPKRVAVAPDVPTLAESGYANLTGGAWQGIFVPAGTSAPVVQHIFTVTHKTLGDGEIAKRLAEGGVDVVTSASPREFSGLVERETALWAKVIKTANITAE
jgi:tripartite-type tricarboxylate transporter receptor subunit TctC